MTLNPSCLWSSDYSPPPRGSTPDAGQREFLLKEYDTAAAEISRRVDHEHDLFIKKLLFVGAVLGSISLSQIVDAKRRLAMLSSGVLLLCCFVSVAVAAVIDTRLMFNTVIIRDHGRWIASVEGLLLGEQPPVRGWESFFADESVLWDVPITLLVSVDRQLLTVLLFVVALYLWNKQPGLHGDHGLRYTFLSMAYMCLGLVALPGLYNGQAFAVTLALLLVAVAVVAAWHPGRHREAGTPAP